MSKPGPKNKPTAIRMLEGNPGNRPFNEFEPKPEKCDDLLPVDWMEEDCEFMKLAKFPLHQVAKMIWAEMAPELDRLGVLTEIDRSKFARYCETFARWLKMKAFIDQNGEAFPVYGGQFEPVKLEDGTLATNERGKVKHEFKKYLKKMQIFPQVAVYARLGETLRKFEEEFGIGAASRTRIQSIIKDDGKGKKADEPDEFDYAGRDRIRAVK